MKVVVIGGGIGGLALAQALRRAGVDVAVHERDEGPGTRWEGYRIHINPAGARALSACLPAARWQEFRDTAGPGGDFGFLTERLRELLVVEESIMYPDGAADPAEDHYAADRATLRRLLAEGLDDVVHYGAEFVGYEVLPDGRVRADFADGRSAVADLLVGADGAASRVRRRLLPGVRTLDAGAVGVAHKIWLTDEIRAALPARLCTGMNAVLTSGPCFLFTSVFEPPQPDARPYLLAALVARPDVLPPDVTELDGDALRVAVDVLVSGWDPRLRRALAAADPRSRTAVAFRATGPLSPWPAGPVTVLGDAIHVMPPIGGLGGNTALRDAHLLGRLLPAVARGERDLLGAVGEYEAEMREYGPAAVRYAMDQKEQTLAGSDGPIAAVTARLFFGLCASVPAVRRWAFGREWSRVAAARAWERAERPALAG
ncbi:FAD-dependent oxidoreductase [Pseudonocardia lacus]|uniref:FAD-dependent oxidoreductase n=1 Tax=Pseudonocardia lacus TaxID=2835865 RepID=UPI001BDC13BC|nr:FAD-dependent monooxygenase [Pseudonocardia lacus]